GGHGAPREPGGLGAPRGGGGGAPGGARKAGGGGGGGRGAPPPRPLPPPRLGQGNAPRAGEPPLPDPLRLPMPYYEEPEPVHNRRILRPNRTKRTTSVGAGPAAVRGGLTISGGLTMIREADVIVIGAGGLGAATAFHLVKRGAQNVVLLDKYDVGSQTSPRAAGMVSCVRKSELMIELIKLAAEKLQRFTEETGQPLDWVRSGSLKVARRAPDVTVIEDDIVRGRRLGLDVDRISPEEAHRLNPFLEPDGVAAVMRVGDDMYFDPAQVAVGFARGAQARG